MFESSTNRAQFDFLTHAHLKVDDLKEDTDGVCGAIVIFTFLIVWFINWLSHLEVKLPTDLAPTVQAPATPSESPTPIPGLLLVFAIWLFFHGYGVLCTGLRARFGTIVLGFLLVCYLVLLTPAVESLVRFLFLGVDFGFGNLVSSLLCMGILVGVFWAKGGGGDRTR